MFSRYTIPNNHKNRQFNNILFFDCEAWVKDEGEFKTHSFRMAWACYLRYTKKKKYEKWQFCRTPEDLHRFILSNVKEKRTLYIMSHNIWYDIRVGKILNMLVKEGYQLKTLTSQAMQFIMKVEKGNKRITFLNFAQFFPMKLKAIGKAIGLEKLDEAWDSEDETQCSIYCRRDVEILVKAWDLWREFILSHNLGNQGYTLASQAMNAFRHRFKPCEIVITRDEKIDELELESYFGGRTETFFIGEVKEKPIYVLDVNSLYPYVMMKFKYPVKQIIYTEKASINQLKSFLDKGYLAIAEVLVDTNENYIPKRYKNRLIFPVGEFKTTLNTETLKLALNKNHIKKVYKMSIYKGEYLFRKYVEYFYSLKLQYEKEGNSAMRLFTKLFLNSLYGKFGQKIDDIISETEIDIDKINREEIIDMDTKEHFISFSLLGKEILFKRRAKLGKYSFVAIASHCTDYARNTINNLRKIAGVENVFYMDTDSLFVNKKGYENLKDYIGENLGMLKLEYITNKLVIFGLKDYETDEYIKRKGIRKDAIRITDSIFEQEQFPKFWSDISKSLNEEYKTYRIKKVLKRQYNKAKVLNNGVVKSFKFKNDELVE